MKRHLLAICLFLICSCFVTYSQFEYYKPDTTRNQHRAGDFIIGLSPNLLLKTPNGVQFAGGLKIQVFISRRFSLDADLVFSRDYIHGGPGLIGIPAGIVAFSSSLDNSDDILNTLAGYIFGAIAVAASFEHISYHISLKNKLDIAPYISLLRYKSAYEYGNYSNPDYIAEQWSFASGVQINKYFGRFVLSPYIEYNVGYKDHISGCNVGAYFGMYFKNKIKQKSQQPTTF